LLNERFQASALLGRPPGGAWRPPPGGRPARTLVRELGSVRQLRAWCATRRAAELFRFRARRLDAMYRYLFHSDYKRALKFKPTDRPRHAPAQRTPRSPHSSAPKRWASSLQSDTGHRHVCERGQCKAGERRTCAPRKKGEGQRHLRGSRGRGDGEQHLRARGGGG